jgi:hypothetical protein
MAVLSTAARNKLSSKSFALPGKGTGAGGKGAGSYPIPDESHGRNALSRVAQHGTPAEKKTVRAKVHAKFPGIGKRQGGGDVEPAPVPQGYRGARQTYYPRGGGDPYDIASPPLPGRPTAGPLGPTGRGFIDASGQVHHMRKGGRVRPHHRQGGGEVTESEEHHAKEKRLLGELKQMEEKEKVEHRAEGGPISATEWVKVPGGWEKRTKQPVEERAHGGPVGKPFAAITAMKKKKNPMASSIGSRGLRDSGPSYPRQAASYVR